MTVKSACFCEPIRSDRVTAQIFSRYPLNDRLETADKRLVVFQAAQPICTPGGTALRLADIGRLDFRRRPLGCNYGYTRGAANEKTRDI